MPTNWTNYVKDFAKANNLTYGCALSDPACSAGYKKKFGNKKPLGKNKETESMTAEDTNRAGKTFKQEKDFKARKTAMKTKLNKLQVQKQLLETIGMMAEDTNQFVPVQDLAGNFVPQEQLQQIKKKRGRPSNKQVAEENIVMDIKEVKSRGRPRKYDTAEEARKAKIANTIAGAKRRKEAKGKGIFSDISKAVKAVVKPAVAVVNKVKDTATAVVYGRQDYPPKVRKIISQYGDKIITGISLHRTPLGKPLMTALQVASGNTFAQKLENTPYDKLFHLFMCIDFAGRAVVLEKNEVINTETSCNLPKGTESRVITSSDIPNGLTLNDALEKTRERMGGNFFTYSAKDNNCQDFIVAFLTANNIGGETDKSWVKQDTKVLFEGNDRLRKIANTFTDIGARVDVLKQGAGIKRKKRKGGMIDEEEEEEDIPPPARPNTPEPSLPSLADQPLPSSRKKKVIVDVKKKRGDGVEQSKAGEPILEGDPVSAILDMLSDDDLVNLFGGLFSSTIAPNQTYRMPNGMLIRITDEQYARMRSRIEAVKKMLQDAPKQTGRKKFDKGDGKGKDLFGVKTGRGEIKKSPVNNIGMANSWIEYVKAYAKKNNMKYNEALKDPKMKAGYKKGGALDPDNQTHTSKSKKVLGSGMPSSRDEYISQLYDQANLGANGVVRLN
jgi:hypothetical protein